MGEGTPELNSSDPGELLRRRLTSGEAPKLTPREPFTDPLFEDANAEVFKSGTQVLLLAATQTERDAMLERFTPPPGRERVLRVFSGAQTYYVGRLGSVDVVLTTCRAGSMPRDGSGLVTYEAIGRVRPRAVVAVGMAFGGYTDKLKIGDILVSTHVIPYEPSRKQDDGDVHRGGEPEAGALLLNRFSEARGWTFMRSDGYACKVRDGRVLSGEKLVDALDFKADLFTAHPEAIGGEMEGSGVYGASARRGITEWLIVKAVCDWGDGTKHKEHQPLAATAAAALVEHVFTPKGVLDDLPPFRGTAEDVVATAAPQIVNNVGTTIGQQTIVFGNQTVVSAPSGDIDTLLSAIKALLKKGLVDEAGVSISDVETRMWSRMDPGQRARTRALRGWRKALLGDEAGAARDFHDAHDQNPSDERALVNRCQGFMLQGLHAEAYKQALAAVSRFENNASLRAFLIKSAPAEIPLENLLPTHWHVTGLASEIAVAAAERVRMADAALAESMLRKVANPEKDDLDYWKTLGTVLVQRIETGEDRDQQIATSTREEAISALKAAYDGLQGPSYAEMRGHFAFMISEQSKQLGRIDERLLWLESARKLIPNSIYVIAASGQEAYNRGDNDLAIRLLRPVADKKEQNGPIGLNLVFAHSLLKLGTAEARSEALAVLEAAALSEAEAPWVRHKAASLLIESYLDSDPVAASTATDRHRAVLGDYHAERLKVVIAAETGEQTEATRIATEMIASKANYSASDVLDLGWLLGRLRMNEECVELLESIAPRDELSPPTVALLNAAMKCGRLELVGSICGALRAAGVEDAQIIDGEAYVRSLQRDLTGALSLVEQWLAKHPDDKRIRLRMSLVAYELGRIELLPTRAEDLPEPTDAQPEIAVHVVQVLRAVGNHDAARRFAYANFKKRRRDEWAWKALSIAALPAASVAPTDGHAEDLGERLPSEAIAGPGMAVRLKEDDTEKWIQLEESDDLATAPDEYPPSHPIAVALTGKKVGDEVELQKGRFGLPPRRAAITAIKNCFVRTSQECNDSYELQFPQSPFIFSFRVPENPDDLIAILTASLKERHQSTDAALRAYGDGPRVSLYGLAEICDRSVFEVIAFLASTGTTIHAARPAERMQAAKEIVQRTREIVVEATAISTLAMLEMLDKLKDRFAKVWVARATVDQLRVYIHSAIKDGSGHIGLDGGQLVYSKRDQAFEAKRGDYLRKLLACVENWEVFREDQRDLLSSAAWDAWTSIAGGGTAESIHFAKRKGLPLWTDDVTLAACGEREGVAPISTQAVFETLEELGVVTREHLSEIGAKLVGWGYVDTRTPPDSFVAAARLANWDASARPLLQHLELLTKANWPTEALALLVAEVFRRWWSDTLDRNAVDGLVVAALIRLAARKNGERLLKLLRLAVPLRFGLDVVGAHHVLEVIVGWTATRFGLR